MDVAIVGGHGQIARLLARRLVADGHGARAVIRAQEQVEDVEADGATPVLHDIEQHDVEHLADAVTGCDALVFAAGAGPGSGAERKWTVDYGGAVQAIRAASVAGVERFVMVSAMGTDDPPSDDEVFSVYLRAKTAADAQLRASRLLWTVIRPGRLTDDDGTGRVSVGRHVERGAVPRDDVAAVIVACLRNPHTIGTVLEVVSGEDEVVAAVDAVAERGKHDGVI